MKRVQNPCGCRERERERESLLLEDNKIITKKQNGYKNRSMIIGLK